jgi:SsrA-binding protein
MRDFAARFRSKIPARKHLQHCRKLCGGEDGELWLVNSYIAPYERAMFGHEERRRRKLLVSRKELSVLWSETQRKGMTLVPMVLYFNHRGKVKLKIGIAKGKKIADKRATEAKRDWNRQKARLLRERG